MSETKSATQELLANLEFTMSELLMAAKSENREVATLARMAGDTFTAMTRNEADLASALVQMEREIERLHNSPFDSATPQRIASYTNEIQRAQAEWNWNSKMLQAALKPLRPQVAGTQS